MIEKQTRLDQIEIVASGTVQFRLGLVLIEDGVELSKQWHRSSVDPGMSVDDQMAAVNDHLVRMGRDRIADADMQKLREIVKVAHTSDVVEKYAAARKAEADAMEAEDKQQ